MSNNKDFKVKNGIKPAAYQEAVGTFTSGSFAVGYKDASLWAYADKSFSVTSQETDPAGFAFKSDGTIMYLIGRTNDTVYQYNLSTAWDVSTSTLDQSVTPFLASAQVTNPSCLILKPDGTKMYILDYGNDDLFQYSLSTAWDVSTASYDSVLLDPSAQEATPRDFRFNADGTKIFLVGTHSDKVHQYSLTTAYNVGTASYDSVFFSTTGQTTNPAGVDFNADASKMYIFNNYDGIVYQYSLPSAYDIANATYDSVSFTVTQDTNYSRMRFSDDGTSLYVVGTGNDTVYQYTTGYTLATATLDQSTGSVFDLTPAANTQVSLSNPAASGTVSSSTLLLDGVTTVVGYDIANAAYDSKTVSLSGSAQDMEAMFFKPDGLTFFALTRQNADSVEQYSVTTAWDISTVNTTPVNSFTTSSQENAAQGLSFKADGTRMYVVGINDVLYEYSLSTAWDISSSSASYNNVNKTLSTNNGPTDLFFKPDGTKFYVTEANYVYEYSLSTAWDITTASLTTKSAAFSTKGGASATSGVYLNGDGTALFTVSSSTDRVYQYPLSTPYAVSSLGTSTISFLFSSQFSGAGAMIFGNNATKMYLPLAGSGSVYQYSTATSTIQSITWDSSIKWSGGTAPESPVGGETDVYYFSTRDGGTSYIANIAIDGAK